MIRATTPKHEFIFTENPSLYEEILISYSQDGRIILEKEKADLTFVTNPDSTYTAWFRLTQVETKKFKPRTDAMIQIRALAAGGNAYASDIIRVPVSDVLNDVVLQ